MKKITSPEIKLLSVRGRFKLVRVLFIDSESTEQIFIVGEVSFGSLKHTLGVVVSITVVYIKRLNHKSNV